MPTSKRTTPMFSRDNPDINMSSSHQQHTVHTAAESDMMKNVTLRKPRQSEPTVNPNNNFGEFMRGM